VTENAIETQPPKERANPLLSRRMVNAHARLSGCLESNSETVCDHRVISRKTMELLIDLYAKEKV
jgi:hypothetical protein